MLIVCRTTTKPTVQLALQLAPSGAQVEVLQEVQEGAWAQAGLSMRPGKGVVLVAVQQAHVLLPISSQPPAVSI